MSISGTLIFHDAGGGERRVSCSGGLDTYAETDNEIRVRGVLNVKGEDLEALRELMRRQAQSAAEPPALRYSGEVWTVERRDKQVLADVPLRILEIGEAGNVRLESDRVKQ